MLMGKGVTKSCFRYMIGVDFISTLRVESWIRLLMKGPSLSRESLAGSGVGGDHSDNGDGLEKWMDGS